MFNLTNVFFYRIKIQYFNTFHVRDPVVCFTDVATSGTMLMAILITAIVLCFGAVFLTSALLYSRGRTRGRCNSEENLMLDSNILYAR